MDKGKLNEEIGSTYKQLLDEVFVISGIKVSVSVISRSRIGQYNFYGINESSIKGITCYLNIIANEPSERRRSDGEAAAE